MASHKHNSACYTRGLRCAIEENHQHSGYCFVEVGTRKPKQVKLSCYKPTGHKHDSGCYIKVLNCHMSEE